jgi:ribosomal protein L12E/L44/L45/RPP1/RPP2
MAAVLTGALASEALQKKEEKEKEKEEEEKKKEEECTMCDLLSRTEVMF